MAEAYQSTDKTSIDTNPKTPRLVHEGAVFVSGFTSYDGGFIAGAGVDITNFNQVKEVTDQIGPSTLNVEVMHVILDGGEYTTFYKAPYYRRFNDVASPSTIQTAWANFNIFNQVNVGDDSFFSTLNITYYTSSNAMGDKSSAFWAQQFRYKIWSTLF